MTPQLASESPSTQHDVVHIPFCECLRMQSFRPLRNAHRLVLLPLRGLQFLCPGSSVRPLRSYEVCLLRLIRENSERLRQYWALIYSDEEDILDKAL